MRATAALWALLLAGGCAGPNVQIPDRLAGPPGDAARETPPRGPITMAQAVELAVSHSGEIAELRARIHVAAREQLAARSLEDPELRANYGEEQGDGYRTRSDIKERIVPGVPGMTKTVTPQESAATVEDSSGYLVGMRFFLPNPWERNHSISAEGADVYAAIADALAAQWALSAEVRRTFVEAQFLGEEHAILGEQVRSLSASTDRIRERVKIGQARVQDLMRVSERLLRAMAAQNDVERRMQMARRELATFTGVRDEDLVMVKDPSLLRTFDSGTLKPDMLELKAFANRKDLSALFWKKRAAMERYSAEKAKSIPWFSFVQASIGRSESSSDRTTTDIELIPPEQRTKLNSTLQEDTVDRDEWRIDTAIKIPLFSWGGSEAAAVLESEWNMADIMEAMARERVGRQIRDAVRALNQVSESRRKFDAMAGPVMDEMQKIMKDIPESAVSPEDKAQIDERVFESRRLRAGAEMDYALAVIDLEAAIGVGLPSSTPSAGGGAGSPAAAAPAATGAVPGPAAPPVP